MTNTSGNKKIYNQNVNKIDVMMCNVVSKASSKILLNKPADCFERVEECLVQERCGECFWRENSPGLFSEGNIF